MDTFWDSFIRKYSSFFVNLTMREILMVFYEFCQEPQENYTERISNLVEKVDNIHGKIEEADLQGYRRGYDVGFKTGSCWKDVESRRKEK